MNNNNIDNNNSNNDNPITKEMDFTGNTRKLCICSHLGNILAPFTFFSGFISLIIYLVKYEVEDEYINFHAKQAFIYALLWFTGSVILTIFTILFSLVTLGCGVLLIIPVWALYFLVPWSYTIYITIVVGQGKNYRIPIIAEWADKINLK